jgi:hypothetical protein
MRDEAARERLGKLGAGMSRRAIKWSVADLDFERHDGRFRASVRDHSDSATCNHRRSAVYRPQLS